MKYPPAKTSGVPPELGYLDFYRPLPDLMIYTKSTDINIAKPRQMSSICRLLLGLPKNDKYTIDMREYNSYYYSRLLVSMPQGQYYLEVLPKQ